MRALPLTIVMLVTAVTPSLAQSTLSAPAGDLASRGLEIQGEAPPACVLEEARTTDLINITGSNSPEGGTTLTLTPQQFINASGFLTASSARLSFRVVCSGAHTLAVSSLRGGLQLAEPVADANGFRTAIDLDVALSWARSTASFDTAAGNRAAKVDIPDAAAGLVDLTIAIPAMTERLVAGVYSDELVIQLTPNN